MRSPIRTALFVALTLAAVAPAAAQPELFPTFSARLGALQVGSDTRLALAGESELATDLDLVDFENDFGLADDETVPTVRLEWQPGRRNRLRLGYQELSRSGGGTLAERDIVWGGVTYPVGAAVTAEIEQETWELDWTFWALRRERGAFGLVLGATVLDFAASATAQVRVGPVVVRELREEGTATAPVPTIGLATRFAPHPRLAIEAEGRFLPGIEVDDVEGDAVALAASLEWLALRHLHLGLGWTSFALDGTIDDPGYRGAFDLESSGVQVFGRIVF